MPTITIAAGGTQEIDLGNTNSMTITANGGNASVNVDYRRNGTYSSAVKGSAGYGNPFNVTNGQTKTVNKSDLESEHVRVGVNNANITVTY
jgi:hypothetical protein